MDNWKEVSLTSISKYPYHTNNNNHLKLIVGDIIEIQYLNGDWVFGKCISTNCSGICPLSHLIIIKDKNDFNLLKIESKILINYIFSHVLIPLKFLDEKDSKIIDLIKIILNNQKNDTNNYIISQSLDEIRSILDFPKVQRASDFSIIRSHNLSMEQFLPDNYNQKTNHQNIFPKTISLSFSIKCEFQSEIIINVRIQKILKEENIILPFHIKFESNFSKYLDFSINNLDSSQINEYCLVFNIFKYNFDSYYYLGSFFEKLNKNSSFKLNTDIKIEPTIIQSSNKDYDVSLLNSFFNNNEDKYILMENPPTISLILNYKESNEKIKTNLNDIKLLSYPINICPSFYIHNQFIFLKKILLKNK